MAFGDERVAERLSDAEQHLELVVVGAELVLGDEPLALVDQPVVVGGDPDVAAGLEQLLERVDEVLPHLVELLEGELGRLDVDPLAQPDVRPQVGKRTDVVDRPAQVGLEDDADVVVPGVAQLAVEPQRVVGRARVLHVDADEVADLGRVGHDLLEVAAAEAVAELEPERRQLHAHVRVQVVPLDRLEHVAVLADDRHRLVDAGDLLAEDVDRRHLPALVEPRQRRGSRR